jgi:hypothetical protein
MVPSKIPPLFYRFTIFVYRQDNQVRGPDTKMSKKEDIEATKALHNATTTATVAVTLEAARCGQRLYSYSHMASRGSRFFRFFWIFYFIQFAIDGKNNSKTKVEKVFFFIFMGFRDFSKKSCYLALTFERS